MEPLIEIGEPPSDPPRSMEVIVKWDNAASYILGRVWMEEGELWTFFNEELASLLEDIAKELREHQHGVS